MVDGDGDGRAGMSDGDRIPGRGEPAGREGRPAQAPAEPSARARMVTERLRREDEQRAREQRSNERRNPFRRAQPARNEPPGWRTGPAWQERDGRAARRRRLRALLAVLLIGGLALITLRPELVIDRLTGKTEAREAARNAPALPAESIRPTAPPAALDPDLPTPKEPFRGSPALQWADGAAGIELPQAQAVGGMSQEKVAKALEQAKAFLVATNLDPATVRGERPTAALDLLDPADPETLRHLEDSLARPGKEQDPLLLVTRFDPAEVRPVGETVKVRGRMWTEPGEGPGQARVNVDYTFVYPLVKARPGAEQVARTIVRRELTFSFSDARRWETTPDRLWLVRSGQNFGNSACDVHDGFLHPSFAEDLPTGPAPSGTPVDPYDRSRNLDAQAQEECGTVSRT
ncbi:hypothetical protein [Streptomyces sp. cmx-4-9]|uniref:hypothetical protein n=1 Tax=Streptomyces sp. cmx-4-9 TaxID=2790941 RepID=UPI0039804C01